MIHTDPWTERLSDYVDGEFDAETTVMLERHLQECATCSETVEDLRAIVVAAPGYVGREPERDLWPAIAEGISHRKEVQFPSAPPKTRRVRPSWIGRVAAAIGLIGIGSGATWIALDGPMPFGSPEPAPFTVVAAEPDRGMLATVAYRRAVDDLYEVLERGRDRLDPKTLQVVEENLQLIDRAIAESEAALAADPANMELRTWISAHMNRKLDLLRRAALAVGGDVSAS